MPIAFARTLTFRLYANTAWPITNIARLTSRALTFALALMAIVRPADCGILVGAPVPAFSYYGMCCSNGNSATAAEFTLTSGQFVSTIDVVLWGGTIGGTVFDFSLQDTLASPTKIFASTAFHTPTLQHTETLVVNAALAAGRYFLVGNEEASSPLEASGWFLSNGALIVNSGGVNNGVWSLDISSGSAFFNAYACGGPCTAPVFAVNGAAVPEPSTLLSACGCAIVTMVIGAAARRCRYRLLSDTCEMSTITPRRFISRTTPFPTSVRPLCSAGLRDVSA